MPSELDPVAVLARTDPAAGRPVPEPPALDELMARPVHRPLRRGRVPVLAAAVVLVVLLAGAAIVVARASDRDREPAPAAEAGETGDAPARLPLELSTPAGPALLALADRVEAHDSDASDTLVPGSGVAYSRSVVSTELLTAGPDRAWSSVREVSQREGWIEPDGTLQWRWASGPPVRAGQVIQVEPDLAVSDADVTAGRGDPRPGRLTRPQGPEAVLADLHSRGDGAYATIGRATDILGEQPLSGPDRAAIYRALVSIRTMRYRGAALDRAGRRGIAFSYQTNARGGVLTEVIVVVDDATGALLETEEVTLESSPLRPVDGPTVSAYRIVLEVATVPAAGDRP